MMKHALILAASLPLTYSPAQADIFKCVVDGKTHYQANPCKEEKHESTLKIRTVDDEANLRGQAALRDFEMQRSKQKLLEAQTMAERAKAQREFSAAQAEIMRAEARQREADAYQDSVESQRQRDAASEKYWEQQRTGVRILNER